MAEHTFHVDVVTPERTVYSGLVTYVNVKAWDGYIGILANHAPLLEQLGAGELRLNEPNGHKVVFAIGGGFMEVSKERTVVLADSVERPEEIDVERARQSRERALARKSGRLETEDRDVARAEMALQRANNRLRMAGVPLDV